MRGRASLPLRDSPRQDSPDATFTVSFASRGQPRDTEKDALATGLGPYTDQASSNGQPRWSPRWPKCRGSRRRPTAQLALSAPRSPVTPIAATSFHIRATVRIPVS